MAFLHRNRPKERRKTTRVPVPDLRAFYWTGGVCQPLRVDDISIDGARIEAAPQWCVGTVIYLVLAYQGAGQDSPNATFGLWARIVRADSRGMGVEFIMADQRDERQFQRFLETSIGD